MYEDSKTAQDESCNAVELQARLKTISNLPRNTAPAQETQHEEKDETQSRSDNKPQYEETQSSDNEETPSNNLDEVAVEKENFASKAQSASQNRESSRPSLSKEPTADSNSESAAPRRENFVSKQSLETQDSLNSSENKTSLVKKSPGIEKDEKEEPVKKGRGLFRKTETVSNVSEEDEVKEPHDLNSHAPSINTESDSKSDSVSDYKQEEGPEIGDQDILDSGAQTRKRTAKTPWISEPGSPDHKRPHLSPTLFGKALTGMICPLFTSMLTIWVCCRSY